MSRITNFTDEQKNLLKGLINDLQGPTLTQYLLSVMEEILTEFKSDWEVALAGNPELRKKIEVCMAALDYVDSSSSEHP